MKQLTFFTDRVETLQATREALTKLGISPRHLHVFKRPNRQHRFDGLVLKSNERSEDSRLQKKVVCLVLLMICGLICLYQQWLNFTGFALSVALFSFVSLGDKETVAADGKTTKDVFFIVVDVEDEMAGQVSRVARQQSDLLVA